jgi:hypothetical protein
VLKKKKLRNVFDGDLEEFYHDKKRMGMQKNGFSFLCSEKQDHLGIAG